MTGPFNRTVLGHGPDQRHWIRSQELCRQCWHDMCALYYAYIFSSRNHKATFALELSLSVSFAVSSWVSHRPAHAADLIAVPERQTEYDAVSIGDCTRFEYSRLYMVQTF